MSTQFCFGFVILHYLAYEMSAECVERILRLFPGNRIRIVIVDNASPNGSGTRLRELFRQQANVDVLLNHQNLGFAQGNNLGYLYLKANYTCDFIVVMNNDVLIEQPDFLERIQSLYAEKHFAVLGPDIYSPKLHGSQSPVYRQDTKNLHGKSVREVRELNRHLARRNAHPCYWWLRCALSARIKRVLFRTAKQETVRTGSTDFSGNMENVVLHGACYVFSPAFIQARNLAFNPGTFMYFEEDILHYECVMSGLLMLYAPCLKVTHLEDVSTDSAYRTSFKKMTFVNKHLERSTAVFLRLADEAVRQKKYDGDLAI